MVALYVLSLISVFSKHAMGQSTAEWTRMKADCRARGGTICENYNDCEGRCAMPASDAGSPAIPVGGQNMGTALSGAIGSVIGGALVPALPPVDPNKYGHKRDDLLNEKVDDGSGSADSAGLRAAQDLLADYSDKPERAKPKPASEHQVAGIIRRMRPFLEFDRTASDHLNPDYNECPSGCGCLDEDGDPTCTDSCIGTCYLFGGKSSDPSKGVDCSGLVSMGNPEFWAKARRFDQSKKNESDCPLLAPNDCSAGTQQQLALLKHDPDTGEDRDDITDLADLRAGDVAYFDKGVGSDKKATPVDHVVQIAGDPSCTDSGRGHKECTATVVQAFRSGYPISYNQWTFIDGKLVEIDGQVVKSKVRFNACGTPPAASGDR